MWVLAALAGCVEAAPEQPDPFCPDGSCARIDGGSVGRVDARVDGSPGDLGRVDVAPVRDVPPLDVARDAGCAEGAACPGGVCRGGLCCPVDRACGDACCGVGQRCFANACVTPGAACRTADECPAGSYCEAALGAVAGADAGVRDGGAALDAGGRVCTAPLPAPGRCLALPPRCPQGDAGVPGDTGAAGCVARCEYRPPVGALNAEMAWSWGQPRAPRVAPEHVDVWSTPAVGRVYDANCDGRVDTLDPPAVVFVSGRSVHATTGLGTCCQCTGTTPTACITGVLRVVDGRTGADLLSVQNPGGGAAGFAGVSVALGDIDNDRTMDIVAVDSRGHIVMIDSLGRTRRVSDMPVPGATANGFGWGGGLALADMDGDGAAEVAFGPSVFTTAGGRITHRFTATGAFGPGATSALSTLVDLDGAANGNLELLVGRMAVRADGTVLWRRDDLPDGFVAVADFDRDGRPEVVLIANGQAYVLNGATGATRLGPMALPGTGSGGPPTVADFDGDGRPEIGVAQANFYAVLKPDFTRNMLRLLWRAANHDLSSSVTGSTVFDFEGDGAAEVIYADECFVWVFDGRTGAVRWTGLTTSFTGTEASVVADVDGDGRAEIVAVSNGADPSAMGWRCNEAPWNTADVATGRIAWRPPAGATAYRGVRVYRDRARSWVGTRPLWNQHTYHVTNICLAGDDACTAPAWDGQIPRRERRNWSLPWLNNFRQNVQQSGLFAAPDATVTLAVGCTAPPELVATARNLGEATLPAGVAVAFFERTSDGREIRRGQSVTTGALFPGAAEELRLRAPPEANPNAAFVARIEVDPMRPTFRECRSDNNASQPARAPCPG